MAPAPPRSSLGYRVCGNGDEGQRGWGDSVFLTTFLFSMLLENVYRSSAECFAITEDIPFTPASLDSPCFVDVFFVMLTEENNRIIQFLYVQAGPAQSSRLQFFS